MRRRPLVLDDSQQVEQLQSQDEIPLSVRVETLENNQTLMIEFLINQGIELPEELIQ